MDEFDNRSFLESDMLNVVAIAKEMGEIKGNNRNDIRVFIGLFIMVVVVLFAVGNIAESILFRRATLFIGFVILSFWSLNVFLLVKSNYLKIGYWRAMLNQSTALFGAANRNDAKSIFEDKRKEEIKLSVTENAVVSSLIISCGVSLGISLWILLTILFEKSDIQGSWQYYVMIGFLSIMGATFAWIKLKQKYVKSKGNMQDKWESLLFEEYYPEGEFK